MNECIYIYIYIYVTLEKCIIEIKVGTRSAVVYQYGNRSLIQTPSRCMTSHRENIQGRTRVPEIYIQTLQCKEYYNLAI